MNAQIIEIKAKGNVVLSQKPGPTTGPLPVGKERVVKPDAPLWQQSKGGARLPVRPAAFLIKASSPAALEITVHIPGVTVNTGWILEGLLDGKILFKSKTHPKVGNNGYAVFEVSAQYQPEGFFWITGTNLDWQVRCKAFEQIIQLQRVDLEIYWLYDKDYSFFKRGVPVEILRQLAEACQFTGTIQPGQFQRKKGQRIGIITLKPCLSRMSAAEWIIEQIVNYCFNRTPPKYDIWEGREHFLVIGDHCGDITLRLNKYLDAINDTMSLCNCCDQAAVLQFYLKLIGIRNVSFCLLQTCGYLRFNRVIGRGYCNNPFADKNGKPWKPLVDERDPDREKFYHHAFCYLGDHKSIVDSCYGPYTGGEEACQYLNLLVDNKYPYNSQMPSVTPMDISRYDDKTRVNWIKGIIHMPQWPPVKGIKKIIRYIHEIKKDILKKVVVRSWPNPVTCPTLQKNGWKTFFEEFIPGNGEVLKTWRLKKDKQRIDIDLYVASGGNLLALNRSCAFVSFITNPKALEVSIEKGPKALRPYSFINRVERCRRWFWPTYNIAFHVAFQDVPDDVQEELVKWLNDLIVRDGNTKEKFDNDLPSVEGISCSKQQPKVNEIVTITLPSQENVFYDFHLSGCGLRLVEEDDEKLAFEAVAKSKNQLVIAAVNQETLLVANREFTIEVKGEYDN